MRASGRVERQPDTSALTRALYLLAACLALQMSGLGIILPVFGRRLEALGSGPHVLGLMTVGFAAAQFVCAPIAGSLADRLGRRPLVLVALGGFAVSNLAFVLAADPGAYIGIRIFEGAVGAGLLPAALGMIGDVVPPEQRARWIGLVTGSSAAGLIVGPVLGGVLYEVWGFAAPFGLSATLAASALVATLVLLPETHRAAASPQARQTTRPRRGLHALAHSLPHPLRVFAILLVLDFIGAFALALIQPVLVFYFYDELRYTTIQYGLVVGIFGLTNALCQAVLPRIGGRVGRATLIALGFLLSTTFYLGLSQVTQFALLFLVAVVAGLGSALIAPALGSIYLEMSEERLRSRVVGIKASAVALAGVLGPVLVVAALQVITPRGIFIAAGALTAVAALLAITALCHQGSATAHARQS